MIHCDERIYQITNHSQTDSALDTETPRPISTHLVTEAILLAYAGIFRQCQACRVPVCDGSERPSSDQTIGRNTLHAEVGEVKTRFQRSYHTLPFQESDARGQGQQLHTTRITSGMLCSRVKKTRFINFRSDTCNIVEVIHPLFQDEICDRVHCL